MILMSVERLKQKNLEKAINGYLEALKTFDKDEHTFLSSKTKNSLGNAYVNLAGVRDPENNLKRAIEAFKQALTIYTKQAFPKNNLITKQKIKKLELILKKDVKK